MKDLLLALLEKNPNASMLLATLTVGIGGAGAGAFATRGMVDLNHEKALSRIALVESKVLDNKETQDRDIERLYNAIKSMDRKLDNLILRDRHNY